LESVSDLQLVLKIARLTAEDLEELQRMIEQPNDGAAGPESSDEAAAGG
jgi:hypothetical protein